MATTIYDILTASLLDAIDRGDKTEAQAIRAVLKDDKAVENMARELKGQKHEKSANGIVRKGEHTGKPCSPGLTRERDGCIPKNPGVAGAGKVNGVPDHGKVEGGYLGGDGKTRTDVPEERVLESIVQARDSAVNTLKLLGIKVGGISDIKVVTAKEGGAYATGSSIVHKHSEETEKEMESLYKQAREERQSGRVPMYAFESLDDRMIHEIGHNIMRKFSKKDAQEWENLFKQYGGDVDNLPSFYAQENSSELWAESVLAVVHNYRFGGTSAEYSPANPAVENFVRSKLGLSGQKPDQVTGEKGNVKNRGSKESV